MIIQPGAEGQAKTTFLVPSFEAERARLLGMPFADDEEVAWVTYEEHWNPYATLASSKALVPATSGGSETSKIKIVVDEEMRDFIARGLGLNGFTQPSSLAGAADMWGGFLGSIIGAK